MCVVCVSVLVCVHCFPSSLPSFQPALQHLQASCLQPSFQLDLALCVHDCLAPLCCALVLRAVLYPHSADAATSAALQALLLCPRLFCLFCLPLWSVLSHYLHK
jgi:hypothetical protein